jgi:hypothetical protein
MYIADQVMPYVPVPGQLFEWNQWTTEEYYTVPETEIGRKSKPNEVEFSATVVPDSTVDHALEDFVPQTDIDEADPGYDPLDHAVEGTTELMLMRREKNVAAKVFDSANYASGLSETLSGTSQFSDYTSSTPIQKLLAALDAMLLPATVMVLGHAVWTKLRQHPEVVEAVKGTGADRGVVTRQELADVLEINQILVGSSYLNSAKEGQTASYSRIWGKHIALLHINPQATAKGAIVTWGFTARRGNKMVSTRTDLDRGVEGGVIVKVTERRKEIVASTSAGYLIQDAIA